MSTKVGCIAQVGLDVFYHYVSKNIKDLSFSLSCALSFYFDKFSSV